MASNVFGKPITDDTLKDMEKYKGKTITRKDRAYEAYMAKDAENKFQNALAYVKNLKPRVTEICALCLIYNATGDPVTLDKPCEWHGTLVPDSQYPMAIENGQWGGFLHAEESETPTGSAAAVVYRGLNGERETCDWMHAWCIPHRGSNHAYTEIREKDHFDEAAWGIVYAKMCKASNGDSDTWNRCYSTVSIEGGKTPVFEGLLTQEGLP